MPNNYDDKKFQEFKEMCREFRQEHGMSVRDAILKKLEGVPRNPNPMRKDPTAIRYTLKTLSKVNY